MDDAWWVQHIFGQSLAATTNPDVAKLAAEVSPPDALGRRGAGLIIADGRLNDMIDDVAWNGCA